MVASASWVLQAILRLPRKYWLMNWVTPSVSPTQKTRDR
jgi:hypothetical protein